MLTTWRLSLIMDTKITSHCQDFIKRNQISDSSGIIYENELISTERTAEKQQMNWMIVIGPVVFRLFLSLSLSLFLSSFLSRSLSNIDLKRVIGSKNS